MTNLTDTLSELRTEMNSYVFAFDLKYCRRQFDEILDNKQNFFVRECSQNLPSSNYKFKTPAKGGEERDGDWVREDRGREGRGREEGLGAGRGKYASWA